MCTTPKTRNTLVVQSRPNLQTSSTEIKFELMQWRSQDAGAPVERESENLFLFSDSRKSPWKTVWLLYAIPADETECVQFFISAEGAIPKVENQNRPSPCPTDEILTPSSFHDRPQSKMSSQTFSGSCVAIDVRRNVAPHPKASSRTGPNFLIAGGKIMSLFFIYLDRVREESYIFH